MKKKGQAIRSRKIEIENTAGRSMEQKGFDDMASITLGDERKVYSTQARADSMGDENVSRSFYETVQKEDKDKRRNLLIFGIVAVVCIALIISIGMLIEHHNEQVDGKIRVNYSSSNFEGAYYEDVVNQLEKQGFTNIKTEPIDDLITGWITKDGTVEKVEIDGYTSFSSSSRYLPDVEIVVRYHTFSND